MTLTINIDDRKLNALRRKVASEGNSLDEFFENYIDSVLKEEYVGNQYGTNNPDVSSELRGKSPMEVIKELQNQAGIVATKDFDEKEDYRAHILRKYA
jgi:hypothetical protein